MAYLDMFVQLATTLGTELLLTADSLFSRVEWYWIEVFEPSKRAQILDYSKIFNFIHDRHIFLALLVK